MLFNICGWRLWLNSFRTWASTRLEAKPIVFSSIVQSIVNSTVDIYASLIDMECASIIDGTFKDDDTRDGKLWMRSEMHIVVHSLERCRFRQMSTFVCAGYDGTTSRKVLTVIGNEKCSKSRRLEWVHIFHAIPWHIFVPMVVYQFEMQLLRT